jgi:hypothetical protein
MMMNIRGLPNDDPYVYESRRELSTIQFRGGSTPARSQSAAGTELYPIESSVRNDSDTFEHRA